MNLNTDINNSLFQDHIQEVLNKWQSIDDEIWAKIIVLERNRRVAKAYARAPVLTVNGSDDGFDGFRIGLAGFDNPMRDNKTEDVKRHIGQVKMNYQFPQKQHTIKYTTALQSSDENEIIETYCLSLTLCCLDHQVHCRGCQVVSMIPQ